MTEIILNSRDCDTIIKHNRFYINSTMKLFYLLNSFIGQYLVQSIVHAVITVIIVDFGIHIWRISNPFLRQKMRFLVVTLPVITFPVYQIINPDRGSFYFRLNEAILDVNRWLSLPICGGIPLFVFFLIILSLTAIVFMLQEFIPIIKHFFGYEEEDTEEVDNLYYRKRVEKALEELPEKNTEVSILNDKDHLIFSTTGRKGVVYITAGLIEDLNDEELKVALAHEIAHIQRNRRPLLIIIFFLRVIMFYNPVTLIEFRRIVEDEEKICDDLAISWTQRPDVLVDTLNKFYINEDSLRENKKKGFTAIEEYSHNMLIKSRIDRIVLGDNNGSQWFWLKFFVVFISVMVINYYIV